MQQMGCQSLPRVEDKRKRSDGWRRCLADKKRKLELYGVMFEGSLETGLSPHFSHVAQPLRLSGSLGSFPNKELSRSRKEPPGGRLPRV